MKIEKQLVSMQIENPLYIGGEIWLDERKVSDIRGLSTLTISGIEAGTYVLSFHTEGGIIKNSFTASDGGIHTLHLAHEFHENELRLRFKEALDIMGDTDKLYRFKELASIPALIKKRDEESGKTLLHTAVDRSSYEAVKILLECGSDPNCQDIFGTTSLMSAVEKSDVDLVKILILNNASVHTVDFHNENALMKGMQVHRNAENIIEKLLKEGVPMDIVSKRSGLTPLLRALKKRECSKLAALLIKNKADIAARDSRGYTAFDLALEGKNRELVRKLMELKVAPATPRSLYRAIDSRDMDIIKYHILYFEDINIVNEYGITPLMYCCSIGYAEGVKFLLELGAFIEKKDSEHILLL